MDLDLFNKAGLVIGGSKGIGLAIAEELTKEGVRVCIMSRSIENLKSAQSKILSSTDTEIKIFQGDASSAGDILALNKFLSSDLGSPDIVINNKQYYKPYSPKGSSYPIEVY